MAHRPTTSSTAPRYEGRVLPRPQEEVQDQGLGFDLTTMSRRRLLTALGLGGVTLGLAACGAATTSSSTATSSTASSSTASSGSASSEATASDAADVTTEIPDETAGPYPGDGSNGPDVLEQSGVVRSDLRSSFGGATGTAAGVPMTLTLTLTDLANGGAAYAGAAVYVWHADQEGRYSLYSDGVVDENYLRGVQVADSAGRVSFTSIFPACYDGRWPHIHFEVYPDVADITDASNAVATSQVALPQATCEQVYATAGYEASVANLAKVSLASDNVFGDDGGVHELGTVTGSMTSGLAVSLAVPVDTRTTPSGGGMAGGPPASR